MKRKTLSALLILCGLVSAAIASAADDLAKLQGSWKVKSAHWYDKSYEEGNLVSVFIKGNRMTFKRGKGPNREESTTFKCDPSQAPKTIDFADPDKPERTSRIGIYALEGDTLTICLVRANEARPKKFVSSPDSRYGLLIVCKRRKAQSP